MGHKLYIRIASSEQTLSQNLGHAPLQRMVILCRSSTTRLVVQCSMVSMIPLEVIYIGPKTLFRASFGPASALPSYTHSHMR